MFILCIINEENQPDKYKTFDQFNAPLLNYTHTHTHTHTHT